MFSMFPLQALWISLTLFFVALVAGWLVDLLFKNQARFLEREDHELELHKEEACHCFSPGAIPTHLRQMTFARAILIAMFGSFLFLLATGLLGPDSWASSRNPDRIWSSSPCLPKAPFLSPSCWPVPSCRMVMAPSHCWRYRDGPSSGSSW
jgi:hypothetical protein